MSTRNVILGIRFFLLEAIVKVICTDLRRGFFSTINANYVVIDVFS